MRKNQAHSVPAMLPIVHRLDILPTAHQLVSREVILTFVTIGAIIPNKKLVGLNSIVTSRSELIFTGSQSETIAMSIGFFKSRSTMIETEQ